MIAVRFALSEKEYQELQSSLQDLDRLFVRSYKAEKKTLLFHIREASYFARFADVRSRYGLSLRCLDMISEKYPASSGISSIRRQTCSLSIPQFSTAEASRLLLVSISLTAFV